VIKFLAIKPGLRQIINDFRTISLVNFLILMALRLVYWISRTINLIITLTTIAAVIPAIPGALGINELTNVAVFVLLGLSPEKGVSLSLVRRVMALIYAGLGLLCLSYFQFKERKKRKTKLPLSLQ